MSVPVSPYNTDDAITRIRDSLSEENNLTQYEFGDEILAINDERTALALKKIKEQQTQCIANDKESKCNLWSDYKDQIISLCHADNIILTTDNFSQNIPDKKGLPHGGHMNHDLFVDVLGGSNRDWYHVQKYGYYASPEALREMEKDIDTLSFYWSWWLNKKKGANYKSKYNSKYKNVATSKTATNSNYNNKRKFDEISKSTMNDTAPQIAAPIKKRKTTSNSHKNIYHPSDINIQNNISSMSPSYLYPNDTFTPSPFTEYHQKQLSSNYPPTITSHHNSNNHSFDSLNEFPSINYMKNKSKQILNEYNTRRPQGKILKQRKRKKSEFKAPKNDKRKISNPLGKFEEALDLIKKNFDFIGTKKFEKKASVLVTTKFIIDTVSEDDKSKYLVPNHIKNITNAVFKHDAFYSSKLQTGSNHTYNQFDSSGSYIQFVDESPALKLINEKFDGNDEIQKHFKTIIEGYIDSDKKGAATKTKKTNKKHRKKKEKNTENVENENTENIEENTNNIEEEQSDNDINNIEEGHNENDKKEVDEDMNLIQRRLSLSNYIANMSFEQIENMEKILKLLKN